MATNKARFSLDLGNKYPYDADDDGQVVDRDDWTHQVARGILCNLLDRRGIKHGFSDIDLDVRKEIIQSISDIIVESLEWVMDDTLSVSE